VNVQDKPVDVQLVGESESVWGDARRIRQILGNVVDNAVKFTNEGSVEVRISADSERWTLLRVTDTGPGIPEEDRNAIFEEYHQVGDVGQRRAGTGLGLAITRRLVQMHGGIIELESEVGEGSCFSIWLPRDEASARAARADDPEEDAT